MKNLNNTQKEQTESKPLSIWKAQQFLRDKVTMNKWCTNGRGNSFMR